MTEFPYKNTQSTGQAGRAGAHGLERMDWSKPALLLMLLFGGIGIIALFYFRTPRSPEWESKQYAAIVQAFQQDPLVEQSGIRIPEMTSWTQDQYGDIDEWQTVLVYSINGNPVSDQILINFNVARAPTKPRVIDWIDLNAASD